MRIKDSLYIIYEKRNKNARDNNKSSEVILNSNNLEENRFFC